MVLKCGLHPKYVLDEMEVYEINAIMKNLHYKNQDNWEIGRLISYCICQTQCRKKITPQDIITFDWDKKGENENITEISNEEIERLRKKASEWESQY